MNKRLSLFEGTGIELEYMIVDRDTLDVRPICDRLMAAAAGGQPAVEADRGPTAWSNELTLHVVETKTNGPAAMLAPYREAFRADIAAMDALLAQWNARLMPTAMHPWMNPRQETQIWPHENNEIYRQFDRIFNCSGHGWSNLQSTHINLPFADDRELRDLHRAIRALLPIMPALAASSPFFGGEHLGALDNRLRFYTVNCKRLPSIAGLVVPEDIESQAEYEELILYPMYKEIAPYDPERILRHEWLNARGAIARFERSAIEIRVLDIQECPEADLAIAELIRVTLKNMVEGLWDDVAHTAGWNEEQLAQMFQKAANFADQAYIQDPDYLSYFDFPGERASAGELWAHLFEAQTFEEPWHSAIAAQLEKGPLARRILNRFENKKRPPREAMTAVYRELCDCLAEGRLFE